MGSKSPEGGQAPHPYTMKIGTFLFDGPPTDSDLSYIPSGRLPFPVTGFIEQRFPLNNGFLRVQVRVTNQSTRRALDNCGLFGDLWAEFTPKDHTGRRRWSGGNYPDAHVGENEVEQGNLWG